MGKAALIGGFLFSDTSQTVSSLAHFFEHRKAINSCLVSVRKVKIKRIAADNRYVRKGNVVGDRLIP